MPRLLRRGQGRVRLEAAGGVSLLFDATSWLNSRFMRREYLESQIALARRRDGGNRHLRVVEVRQKDECVCGTAGCRRLWSECEVEDES